jgi:hypothetical protein
VVLPPLPGGAFGGDESEEVLGGDRVLSGGYRYYVEPLFILLEGFPEGAVFRAPLDQEFFYPSRATVVADAYLLATGQNIEDGRFLPRGHRYPGGVLW